MGGLSKVVDNRGNVKWRASIHRKGCTPINKRFTDKNDAKRWIREQERSIETTGLPITIDALRKHTLGSLVERYIKHKTVHKGCAVNETFVLKKFLRHPICRQHLPISKQDAYAYIDQRLGEVSPSTVRRETNSIQHIFVVAKKEWGLTNLENPFEGIDIKGPLKKRRRRLNTGELEVLLDNCKYCRGQNERYVGLAIRLAVETAMRLDEIFNLKWGDIDIKRRTITIRKRKVDPDNDKIVLTFGAFGYLWTNIIKDIHPQGNLKATVAKDVEEIDIPAHSLSFQATITEEGRISINLDDFPMDRVIYNKNTNIFPMSKEAFKQAFKKLVVRSAKQYPSLADLQFRDLRREAGSRFEEAELTKAEHDLMMGHKNSDIKSTYTVAYRRSIQDKLDKYFLNEGPIEKPIKEKRAIEDSAAPSPPE
jgi:integrase